MGEFTWTPKADARCRCASVQRVRTACKRWERRRAPRLCRALWGLHEGLHEHLDTQIKQVMLSSSSQTTAALALN